MSAQKWFVLALVLSTLKGAGAAWVPPVHTPIGLPITNRSSLTSTPNQSPPDAVNDSASTPEDIPKVIDVLNNDSDPDGNLDYGSVTILGAPHHATTQVHPTTGKVTYSPDLNYNGTDQFVYQVCDTTSLCNWALVDVTITPVNDPPVASDDNASTAEDTPVLVPVLANDDDVDGNLDPGSVEVLPGQAPDHGTANVDPSTGGITYDPDQDYYGGDSFKYQVCDQLGGQTPGDCDTASVTISVSPINDAPLAAPNNYQVTRNAMLHVAAPGVLQNDSDVEGDAITAVLDSMPTSGTVSLNPDGSFNYLTEPNFAGMVSFRYRAKDQAALSNATTVQIQVQDPGTKSISVFWNSPVVSQGLLQVKNETVTLEARVTNCGPGCQVRFFRWDAKNLRYVHIGLDPAPPYQYLLDSRSLNPTWNQIFAVAFDSNGDVSDESFIWLYRITTIYFPVVHR